MDMGSIAAGDVAEVLMKGVYVVDALPREKTRQMAGLFLISGKGEPL